MIGSISRKASPAAAVLLCLAMMVIAPGCAPVRPRESAPLAVVVVAPPPSDFTIAAGMLDTWNAIGQILVRTDGVRYEGRSQMLGLYDVRYQGERILILARALALTSQERGTTTRVSTTAADGKPNSTASAVALLGSLQAQLPDELRAIKDIAANDKAAKDKAAADKAKASRSRHRKRMH